MKVEVVDGRWIKPTLLYLKRRSPAKYAELERVIPMSGIVDRPFSTVTLPQTWRFHRAFADVMPGAGPWFDPAPQEKYVSGLTEIVCASRTLRDCLQTLHASLYNPLGIIISIDIGHRESAVSLKPAREPGSLAEYVGARHRTSLLLTAARLTLGDDWKPIEIQLGGMPVMEGAPGPPETAWTIRTRDLDAATPSILPPSPPPLASLAPHRELSQIIEDQMDVAGVPNADVAAEIMGVSRRSLYRELEACGTTYKQLTDAIRTTKAKEMLRLGTPVGEVGHALGYPSSKVFARAFRRKTGSSPSDFMRRFRPV